MAFSSEQRTLRVLAADDSPVMRSVFRTVFQLHAEDIGTTLPRMDLCGVAEDGMACLRAVRRLQPDVLILDFEMPVLDGLEVLSRLRVEAPWLPVILCSAHTERGARVTLDALALGARDYVMKPRCQNDFAVGLDVLMKQLLTRIAAIAYPASPEKTFFGKASISKAIVPSEEKASRLEIVTIGVSTGGPSALEMMLPMLPHDLPVPVMIVQHMPRMFTGALAKRLDRICALKVAEAVKGESVKAGCIYLAPGDAHMEVRVVGRDVASATVHLHQGAPRNSCKPSVDYLFHSAAERYGAATLALVMTGMGSDGVEGAREVHAIGGVVLAQDEASSAVWGMPGRVSRAGIAQATLPLDRLAGEIVRLVYAGRRTGGDIASAPQRMTKEEPYGVL